jgi:hypothetical protein
MRAPTMRAEIYQEEDAPNHVPHTSDVRVRRRLVPVMLLEAVDATCDVELKGTETVLGRCPQFKITSLKVSRQHCRVTRVEDPTLGSCALVEPLKRTGIVLVNGTRRLCLPGVAVKVRNHAFMRGTPHASLAAPLQLVPGDALYLVCHKTDANALMSCGYVVRDGTLGTRQVRNARCEQQRT